MGSNGTFADSCDAEGNLLGYQCEAELKCFGAPNPSCTYTDTGLVQPTPTVVDCAGSCSGGHCDGRCPQQGDHLTFRAAAPDGTAQIHNDTDGRTYRCSLDYDLATDAFDCKTVAAGQAARVTSRSTEDNHCTGADFGGIGLTLDGVAVPGNVNESCAYQCGILPDPCKAR